MEDPYVKIYRIGTQIVFEMGHVRIGCSVFLTFHHAYIQDLKDQGQFVSDAMNNLDHCYVVHLTPLVESHST